MRSGNWSSPAGASTLISAAVTSKFPTEKPRQTIKERRLFKIPRLVIAGLGGDCGKTFVALSLLAALRRRGWPLSVFKKGPDYIDAAWLTKISGQTCRSLDTYMAGPACVYRRFVTHAKTPGLAIIEGNRGIFDGKGANSTADLAKLLKAPVVLVVDAAKTTRTVAALINGCLSFTDRLDFAGVILNKVAGPRHKAVLTAAIKRYCHVPVLGMAPRLADDAALIPNRHLGLVTPSEFSRLAGLGPRLAAIAERCLDIQGLIRAAQRAAPLAAAVSAPAVKKIGAGLKIGYFKDSAFTFYYPENLEALSAYGAKLVPISPLRHSSLGSIDALYIGGGFPETHARQLSVNRAMMRSVRQAGQNGLPIYAECGGLIYLSRSLIFQGRRYPMAGLFRIELVMHPRPVGHGYTHLRVVRPNPFFKTGLKIKGHEFHYSGLTEASQRKKQASIGCMKVETGTGLGNKTDGLVYKNVLGCYTHIHSDAVKTWASRLVLSASCNKK
ncbi:MAG: cobyrinate a,c-diamide synthase [Elusimicrobia bacterium]|nr:cobyrinate a,c-diamide synthase [Elusimicrobiota bacterium]